MDWCCLPGVLHPVDLDFPGLLETLTLIHEIHLGHFTGSDAVNDVNVWFHGLVATVSGPFHDDIRGDTS